MKNKFPLRFTPYQDLADPSLPVCRSASQAMDEIHRNTQVDNFKTNEAIQAELTLPKHPLADSANSWTEVASGVAATPAASSAILGGETDEADPPFIYKRLTKADSIWFYGLLAVGRMVGCKQYWLPIKDQPEENAGPCKAVEYLYCKDQSGRWSSTIQRLRLMRKHFGSGPIQYPRAAGGSVAISKEGRVCVPGPLSTDGTRSGSWKSDLEAAIALQDLVEHLDRLIAEAAERPSDAGIPVQGIIEDYFPPVRNPVGGSEPFAVCVDKPRIEAAADEAAGASAEKPVASALGAMGSSAADYVDVIGSLISDVNEDNRVRRAACRALGHMGRSAAPYEEALLAMMAEYEGSQVEVNAEIERVLGRIRVASRDGQVIEMLEGPNVLVRLRTVQDIARECTKGDTGMFQLVIGRFLDADAGVRCAAVRAAAKMAIADSSFALPPAIAGSMSLLQDGHPRVRRTAIEGLHQLSLCSRPGGGMEHRSSRVLQAIMDRVSADPDNAVQVAAAAYVCLERPHRVLRQLPGILQGLLKARTSAKPLSHLLLDEGVTKRGRKLQHWSAQCAAWVIVASGLPGRLPKEVVENVADSLLSGFHHCSSEVVAALKA